VRQGDSRSTEPRQSRPGQGSRGLILQLLLLTIFLSMCIPRSGTKIRDIPVTLPILLYLLILLLSFLRPYRLVTLNVAGMSAGERLAISGALAFMIVSFVAVAVGAIRGAMIQDILVETASILGFVPVFLLVIAYVRDGGTLRKVVKLMVVAVAIVSIYGVCQRLFGHYNTMIPGITIAYSDAMVPDAFDLKNNLTAVGLKVVSTFQNGNLFGNFLALTLPLPALLFHRARGLRKLLYLCLLALVMSVLLLSLSRSAIVAGIVSLGILCLILRRAVGLWVILGVLVVIGGSLVYVFQLTERLLTLDLSLAGRTVMWQDLAAIYEDLTPARFILAAIFGLGMGATVGPPALACRQTESSLLVIGMKTGVIGILLWTVSFFGIFICVLRWSTKARSLEGQVGCALVAGLLGASLQLAIDSVMMMPPTAMNLWLVAGLALVSARIAREQLSDEVVS